MTENKSPHTRKWQDQVIKNAEYCHLACAQDDEPYLIPLAFGYDGEYIYLHTAPQGKKVSFFTHNPAVCLSFENDVKLIKNSDAACEWSFQFRSVIAAGMIEEIKAPESKYEALNCIMAHYSNLEWDFPEKKVTKTKLWRVHINTISGKESN